MQGGRPALQGYMCLLLFLGLCALAPTPARAASLQAKVLGMTCQQGAENDGYKSCTVRVSAEVSVDKEGKFFADVDCSANVESFAENDPVGSRMRGENVATISGNKRGSGNMEIEIPVGHTKDKIMKVKLTDVHCFLLNVSTS